MTNAKNARTGLQNKGLHQQTEDYSLGAWQAWTLLIGVCACMMLAGAAVGAIFS